MHKTAVSVGGDLGTRTDVIELNFYFGASVDENNKEKYKFEKARTPV